MPDVPCFTRFAFQRSLQGTFENSAISSLHVQLRARAPYQYTIILTPQCNQKQV